MTLAQGKERAVPKNSTSITVSLQQEAYICGLASLGNTLWRDTGFGERFLVTAAKPYRCVPLNELIFFSKIRKNYVEDL